MMFFLKKKYILDVFLRIGLDLRTIKRVFYKKIVSKFEYPIARYIVLPKIAKEYPEVHTTSETLGDLIHTRKSICRFGDGEFLLLLGKSLGVKGAKDEYQVFDPRLQARLRAVLQSTDPAVMVAIPPYDIGISDIENFYGKFSFNQYFLYKNWVKIKKYLFLGQKYYNSFVSRVNVFEENQLESVKKVWENRKVVFVVGEYSRFIYEKRLFDNIKESKIIYAPSQSAFSAYDDILSRIAIYDTTHLIFISLGPTATVLAYDLAKLGYQALDMGHLPNCFLQAIGERKSPEIEAMK